VILILYRAGLFSEGLIVLQDYPIHYFDDWYSTVVTIPIFKNINSLCIHYQLGYTFYDHPIGSSMFVAILYYLFSSKIPLWVFFRIIVGFAFILPIFAIYFLAKKLEFPSIVALLASILWLSWSHGHFLDGTYLSYYALSFSIFSLYFYIDYSHKKKLSALFSASIFFVMTLFFQGMFIPSLFIILLIYTFLNYNKIGLKPFLIIVILGIFTGSTYFASILNRLNYFASIFTKFPEVFYHLYDINYIFWKSFYEESNFIVILSLPLILLMGYKKFNKHLSFLLLTVFFLCLMVFVSNYFQVTPFFSKFQILKSLKILSNAFLIERIVFLTKAFFGILSAYTVYLSLKLLDKKNFYVQIFLSLIIASLVLFVASYFHYLWGAWYKSDDFNFPLIYDGWKLEQWYSLKFDHGVFRNTPKEDVIEMFNFLKYNTNNNARILVEDSHWGKLGGNIMAMGAYYTDRLFVGGMHQGVMLPGDTWAVDGIFFGKNITDYKINELKNKLDDYNVGWIVAWTPITRQYIDSYPQTFRVINETSSKLFKIYAYLDSPMSYVKINNKEMNANLYKLTNDSIVIYVNNASEKNSLILKFRYEKDWHAYVDGKEIPIKTDGILMQIDLPKNGDYIIMLKYEEAFLVMIAKYISIILFVSILIMIVYFKIKNQ
jgi:hypothetical protein